MELRTPSGSRTRPTTGRLREALFAMLQAAGVSFAEVLDLYAGSGALGIEALSRGTGRATFVESDRRASAVIRENLARLGFADRGTVVTARVGRWQPPPDTRYTLVLADPPYEQATYDDARGGAGMWLAIDGTVRGALADRAVIVVEHEARHAPPEFLAGQVLWRDRRHGAGAVAIYRPVEDGFAGAKDEGETE